MYLFICAEKKNVARRAVGGVKNRLGRGEFLLLSDSAPLARSYCYVQGVLEEIKAKKIRDGATGRGVKNIHRNR